ncbi:MAG: MATE family efflux transporter [Bacteroidetes bacterium GWA2_30_7]|nr:MAG: MATE family efflux transporter [Bacteroidetes bacterium GWA2_30_7]
MKDLTIGKESNRIFFFALPMLLGNVFQQLYNIVDSVIVGHFIGKEALAAVGASFPIIFIMISLIIGVSNGFTIIIAQYFGAKDFNSIIRAIDTMNIVLFISSIVLSVVGIISIDSLFTLLRLPLDVFPMAKQYLQIYLSGLVVFFGYNGLSAILRGLGDSKTPLYFLILSTLLNIGLDLLFILVFKWGVAGAAYATVISQTIAFLALAYYLHKTHDIIKISFLKFNFDKKLFKTSLKIGLPSGLQHTFVSLGMMAILGIVNGFGTSVLAAYTVAVRIDSLASIPAMNFSMALSTFVGQNIGANKMFRVKKGLISTLIMSSIISIVVSLVVVFFGKQLMAMFTTDHEVIYIGESYLIIVCSFYVLFSTMFVFQGALRGAGDTLVPMFITLFALWVIRIPLAYFFSKEFGYFGIWWSIPLAWFFGMTFSIIYFFKGNWKSKTLIKHKNSFESANI